MTDLPWPALRWLQRMTIADLDVHPSEPRYCLVVTLHVLLHVLLVCTAAGGVLPRDVFRLLVFGAGGRSVALHESTVWGLLSVGMLR